MQNPYENDMSQRMGAMLPQALDQKQKRPVDLAEEFLNMQKYFLDYSLVTRRMTQVFSNIRRATQVGR
jgi:hypothetical protein